LHAAEEKAYELIKPTWPYSKQVIDICL